VYRIGDDFVLGYEPILCPRLLLTLCQLWPRSLLELALGYTPSFGLRALPYFLDLQDALGTSCVSLLWH
jgi:hypothetical protein